MRIEFRPPTKSDIAYVAENMREMDRRECWLVSRELPQQALEASVSTSSWAYAAVIEGEPVCIFGLAVSDFLGEEGVPWFLAIRGIERHARALLTSTPRFLQRMREETPQRLYNVVHADNRSAIRYLTWCGFHFGDGVVVSGEPFLEFEMRGAA